MNVVDFFLDKKGLEIGGPSPLFSIEGSFPIYQLIADLDGCNFSSNTIWQGIIQEGQNYKYDEGKIGYQYICDVTDLSSKIIGKKYDFVLSCNSLEHVANPLKAIEEMLSILKEKGVLLLVLPKKDGNFDHNRSIVAMDHLLDDYKSGVKEDDLSHLDEILKLHDLKLDPPAGNLSQFKARSLQNYENRALHHHVFDMKILLQIYDFFRLSVYFYKDLGQDFIIIGG